MRSMSTSSWGRCSSTDEKPDDWEFTAACALNVWSGFLDRERRRDVDLRVLDVLSPLENAILVR